MFKVSCSRCFHPYSMHKKGRETRTRLRQMAAGSGGAAGGGGGGGLRGGKDGERR